MTTKSITYPDGSKYEGGWKDGKPHGWGKYTFPDDSNYEGEYRNGKRNGQGILIFPNGEKYEGEFRDGKRHGHGTYTKPDGSQYVGEWKDDKRHGEGTNINKTGLKDGIVSGKVKEIFFGALGIIFLLFGGVVSITDGFLGRHYRYYGNPFEGLERLIYLCFGVILLCLGFYFIYAVIRDVTRKKL